MAFEERMNLLREVERLRGGRTLVCFFNFDRQSTPPIPGLQILFQADAKEALFRLLREESASKVDLCLYTRGGDTNSVWPIVSIIREFDPDFEVLVPYRCHSSGTLVVLGANRSVLTPLAELSPIDPSTGNQFNPVDPVDKTSRMAISVEDVSSYRSFVVKALATRNHVSRDEQAADESRVVREDLPRFLEKLVRRVHPLALGNVERVIQQIRYLAKNLLALHPRPREDVEKIIEGFTTEFWSHVHMINRQEAKKILGNRVVAAPKPLASALDKLLRQYEDSFGLRSAFFLLGHLGDEPMKKEGLIGGVLETKGRSYVFETQATLRQQSVLPPNVQIQLPPGQPMPLIPGLLRQYQVDVTSQGWVNNKEKK